MRHLRLLIFVIGIFQSGFSFAQEEVSAEFSGKPGMVYVEPSNVISTEIDGEYKLVPYKERRPKWGTTFSVGYSSYEPIYYEPDFVTMDPEELYSSPDTPLIEIKFAVKRNAPFGSIGGELGVGIYMNNSDVDETIIESSLEIIPVTLGGVLTFDTIGREPFVAPFLAGGLYTMIYKEETDSRTLNGNTQVAPFMSAGVNFLLDWLDRKAARTAFHDSGVQASYLYASVSKYFESSAAKDKDFSNDANFAVGLRVEF
jgi:hypothetical protein